MTDDHAQRTLEQKALSNVRAELDRVDPDAPVRTVGAAASHMALTLPIVIGALVLALGIAVLAIYAKRTNALAAPRNLDEYAQQVFAKAETVANQNRRLFGDARGDVEVAFVVTRTGQVVAPKVTRSSKDMRADIAATSLLMLVRLGNFPPGSGTDSLPLRGTWTFADGSATFRLAR